MSENLGSMLLNTSKKLSPSQSFCLYCEIEFERNRDADQNFEAEDYRDAIELTLRKLKLMEEGETK